MSKKLRQRRRSIGRVVSAPQSHFRFPQSLFPFYFFPFPFSPLPTYSASPIAPPPKPLHQKVPLHRTAVSARATRAPRAGIESAPPLPIRLQIQFALLYPAPSGDARPGASRPATSVPTFSNSAPAIRQGF